MSLIGSDVLKIEYVVVGAISTLKIPPLALPEFIDDLWKRNCFELFIGQQNGHYVECNFSPSRQWATYYFEGYRSGMAPAMNLPAPDIYVESDQLVRFATTNWIDVSQLYASLDWRFALSAIIEESDGTKSYWALAHPPGEPDFHHPDCFALQLEAPTKL